MRKISRLAFFLTVAILLVLAVGFGTAADSQRGERYLISEEDGIYSIFLYQDGSPGLIAESESLSGLLELVGDSAEIVFDGVESSEGIRMCRGRNIRISGSLSFSGSACLTLDEKSAVLGDINLEFESGGLNIKGGRVTLESGGIEARGTAIRQENADSSVFYMLGGSVSTASDAAAFILKRGTAKLLGGEISSAGEYAVESRADLYISSDIIFSSAYYGIYTERAISLSDSDFDKELRIKYGGLFEKGVMTEILFGACAEDVGAFRVFDRNSKEYEIRFFERSEFSEERCFMAVFEPLTVSFKHDGNTVLEVEAARGAYINEPMANEISGFTFCGWYYNEQRTERCLFDFAIEDDLTLYASYSLNAPEFRISSKSVVYDSRAHKFSLDSLYHPLENDGAYSFDWMKNGKYFSSGEEITLYNVMDSGEYCCKITFNYSKYCVSVVTPTVNISVSRASVPVPTVYSKSYCAEKIFPDILPSTLYTAKCVGGTDVGLYPVELTLRDGNNYRWDGGDSDTVYLNFEITKVENRFVQNIDVFDVYFLADSTFEAKSLFGSIRMQYRGSDGSLLSEPPSECGDYFVSAIVDETENYYGLCSEPLPFRILSERAVGLTVVSPPSKTEYIAFDEFNPSGLELKVSFNSGRSENIGADKLSFSYQSADSFRFGDSAVTVSYFDATLYIPVKVKRASYDLDGILFGDLTYEYSGFYISPTVDVALPTGLDGIPLRARIEGGGTDVGAYPLKLIFYTESANYNIPSEMHATLTVTERRVSLAWSNTVFIYNGKRQCPSAGFTDAFGVFKSVDVSGGEYVAGVGFIAVASSVKNYIFENPSVAFTINKADYDLGGVFWSDSEFVYSGDLHSVVLCGLPSGVKVSGYADNTARTAGEYTASVTLTYDEFNYNEPTVMPFVWRILPAEYDMSDITLEDAEFVFDGEMHYPILRGEMPTGADGSSLRYEFSLGARHVSDGTTEVAVTFYTDSNNYVAPNSLTGFVRITPAPISVVWNRLSFTYNACEHVPTAYSGECAVTVLGGGTDAGKYTARAVSNSSDYFILNSEADFEIKKAENRFLSEVRVYDSFEGDALICDAEAFFGDAVFIFYADSELTRPIQRPTAFGVYYAVATVAESTNYLPLFSESVEFRIIEAIPTRLYISLSKSEYTAFELVEDEDFIAYLIYNNGDMAQLSSSEIKIRYERAESLRAGDAGVDFIYGDFLAHAVLEVKRATYDMSRAEWADIRHVYDGRKKYARVVGLPESVTLLAVEGGVGIYAGEYRAHAVFEYDEENYECPSFPDAFLVIEPAVLEIPQFDDVIYDGNFHLPDAASDEWRIDSADSFKDVGEYEISVILTDGENYVFRDGGAAVKCSFKIVPRDIYVTVSDIKLYLGEKYKNPQYEILGEVAPGDDLGISYLLSDERVDIISSNPNYRLIVKGGNVAHSYLLSPSVMRVIYIILLLLAAFVLLLITLKLKKRKLLRPIALDRGGAVGMKKEEPPHENSKDTRDERELHADIELKHFSTPMDAERADALISNSLAKDLIGTGEESILTSGRRKSVINIDTLSDSFSSGERVDVNILKNMNLVPYDTAYIKVLARGMIDKPLFVYANDFSSTAVKMLALTGGKAIKVNTVKYKETDGTLSARADGE